MNTENPDQTEYICSLVRIITVPYTHSTKTCHKKTDLKQHVVSKVPDQPVQTRQILVIWIFPAGKMMPYTMPLMLKLLLLDFCYVSIGEQLPDWITTEEYQLA